MSSHKDTDPRLLPWDDPKADVAGLFRYIFSHRGRIPGMSSELPKWSRYADEDQTDETYAIEHNPKAISAFITMAWDDGSMTQHVVVAEEGKGLLIEFSNCRKADI